MRNQSLLLRVSKLENMNLHKLSIIEAKKLFKKCYPKYGTDINLFLNRFEFTLENVIELANELERNCKDSVKRPNSSKF